MALHDAVIAANRFGLGARPGELKAIAGDPRGWLKSQLTPENALPAPLAALPSTTDDAGAFRRWIQEAGLEGSVEAYGKAGSLKPAADGSMADGMAGARAGTPASRPGFSVEQSFIAFFGPRYDAALAARFQVAVASERPFFERMTHFWGNHFTVSAAKPATQAMPPSFERDVARRHAMGRFEDMLLASCKHPGMLVYLDNYTSVGPNSVVVRNPMLVPAGLRAVLKGLNENLAREILELHTLGVHGGYTQADVTTLAKIITGWSLRQRPGANGDLFQFVAAAHEPGTQVLLDQTFRQDDVMQGVAALKMLAAHPSTARFLATKLTRHFVADDPPPEAVGAIAKVYLDTDGDLAAICSALVDLPQAWDPTPRKMKPPEQYLISASRALGGLPLTGRQLSAVLGRMGQRPYYAQGPNGWPDTEGEWVGPDPVWKRLEWATAMAKGAATAQIDPVAIAASALGETVTQPTLQAIRRAESPSQGLAILLVSPEFQRR
jgi:uncharacterized protein (DUF1800 family)